MKDEMSRSRILIRNRVNQSLKLTIKITYNCEVVFNFEKFVNVRSVVRGV